MRPVVGGVDDDRVLGQAELVQQAQQVADQIVGARSKRDLKASLDRVAA